VEKNSTSYCDWWNRTVHLGIVGGDYNSTPGGDRLNRAVDLFIVVEIEQYNWLWLVPVAVVG
jgi:hypothetical protein